MFKIILENSPITRLMATSSCNVFTRRRLLQGVGFHEKNLQKVPLDGTTRLVLLQWNRVALDFRSIKLSYSFKKKVMVSCLRGALMTITVTSPIGEICICSCPEGLHSVTLETTQKTDFNPRADVPIIIKEDVRELYTPVAESINWLTAYFSKIKNVSTPCVCSTILKGNFRENVWFTLANEVPFGSTLSYSELAMKCLNPKAARAVGTAMKMNPIPIIIPCHRVLKNDGTIGNYSSGSHIKEWLLKHEKSAY